MKISKKSDYALRALSMLSEDPGRRYTIKFLAEKNDIPKRFLEHIMLDMKNLGWVKGVSGRDGGYHLGVSPDKLTFAAVIRHFDGMIAPISCVSTAEYKQCSQEPICRFRRLFLDIRNMSTQMMERSTFRDLLSMKPVMNTEVESYVFSQGGGI